MSDMSLSQVLSLIKEIGQEIDKMQMQKEQLAKKQVELEAQEKQRQQQEQQQRQQQEQQQRLQQQNQQYAQQIQNQNDQMAQAQTAQNDQISKQLHQPVSQEASTFNDDSAIQAVKTLNASSTPESFSSKPMFEEGISSLPNSSGNVDQAPLTLPSINTVTAIAKAPDMEQEQTHTAQGPSIKL